MDDFNTLQAKLKDACFRETKSEQARVAACKELENYYNSFFANNPKHSVDFDFSPTWGGECDLILGPECHGVLYYEKHLDEVLSPDARKYLEMWFSDPEYLRIRKNKEEALKNRKQAREERDFLRTENQNYIINRFIKTYNGTVETYDNYAWTAHLRLPGYVIHIYNGKIDGISIPNGPSRTYKQHCKELKNTNPRIWSELVDIYNSLTK